MSKILRNSNHGEGGFTLVELMIVISILAALAALIMPSLSNAKRRAAEAKTIGVARCLQAALVDFDPYSTDPKKSFPVGVQTDVDLYNMARTYDCPAGPTAAFPNTEKQATLTAAGCFLWINFSDGRPSIHVPCDANPGTFPPDGRISYELNMGVPGFSSNVHLQSMMQPYLTLVN